MVDYSNVIHVGVSMLLLIILGYVCTKFRWVPKEESDILNRCTFKIAFFSLTLRSLAGKDAATMNYFPLAIGSLMAVTVYILMALILVYPNFKDKYATYLSTVFPANYVNYVISGMPIFTALWDVSESTMIPMITLANDLVTSPIFLAMCALYKIHKHKETHPDEPPPTCAQVAREVVLRMLKNPILLGNLVGLVYAGTALPVSTMLSQVFNMLGDMCLAYSLFCVGAFLSQHSFMSCHWLKFVTALVVRLFIGPIIAGIYSWALGLSPRLARQCIIIAAQPTAVACFTLTDSAGVGSGAASTMIFWSTALTVPALIVWFTVLNALHLFEE